MCSWGRIISSRVLCGEASAISGSSDALYLFFLWGKAKIVQTWDRLPVVSAALTQLIMVSITWREAFQSRSQKHCVYLLPFTNEQTEHGRGTLSKVPQSKTELEVKSALPVTSSPSHQLSCNSSITPSWFPPPCYSLPSYLLDTFTWLYCFS